MSNLPEGIRDPDENRACPYCEHYDCSCEWCDRCEHIVPECTCKSFDFIDIPCAPEGL